MHLSAILVTANRSSSASSSFDAAGLGPRQRQEPESVSLACVEIFGQSILERTVNRLQKADVRGISVIASPSCDSLAQIRGAKITTAQEQRDRWAAAGRMLRKHARCGTRTVLLAELGAYAEVDLAAALEFHKTRRQHVTPLHDASGALGYWIIETSEMAVEPDFRLPFFDNRVIGAPYLIKGHVNRMRAARDLRRLVIDSFLGRCSFSPPGHEMKPGVWVDKGARIHKSARLVAPAYLGRNTSVQPASVVTQFSNLERSCHVGMGSVVSNASVLPHTMIGRGLDVSAAVVDRDEFVDLRRNVTLTIRDSNLISGVTCRQPQMFRVSEQEEHKDTGHLIGQAELEPPHYLSRAAGKLIEAFKDEA